MKKLLITITLLLALACGSSDYTVEDFESIGFKKEKQPFFMMVGGIDGWKGTYNNESVEIIFFDQENNLKTFLTGQENSSFYNTVCRIGNTVVMSNENSFCELAKNELE